MDPIRVMVVDDSVVVRKIVTDVLSEDPGIQVVGTAVNGRIALGKLALWSGAWNGIGLPTWRKPMLGIGAMINVLAPG